MTQVVQIPLKTFKKLESFLERMEQEADEWISEDEAAKLLKLTVKSFRNRVYNGDIPKSFYITGALNKRFYSKNKLKGL